MSCEKTQFQEETSVKIQIAESPCDNCGDAEGDALVRYNAEYCHIDSANFSARPTKLDPPCDGQGIGTRLLDVNLDDGDPPISNPNPVDPPTTEDPNTPLPPDDLDPEDDPDDDPNPPDDPDPPPPEPPPPTQPKTQFRYPVGMWYSSKGCGRIGTEPCRDGMILSKSDILFQLNKAKAGNYQVALLVTTSPFLRTQAGDPELDSSNALYDPTAVIGGYNIRRHKEQLRKSFNNAPDVRSFVSSGTLLALVLFDDFVPGAESFWFGRIPTGDEVDEVARYAKSFIGWSTVPTAGRGPTAGLKQMRPSGFEHLDIAWVQMKKAQFGANRSTIKSEILAEINRAKAVNLGFIGIGNLLNQGSGIDWDVHPDKKAPLVACSPDDIRAMAQALHDIGDYLTRGHFYWGDTNFDHGTNYFLRGDIQSAFFDARDLVKNLKLGPINYRDGQP